MEGPVCTVKARATPGDRALSRSRCSDLEELCFKGTNLVRAGGVRSLSMLTDDDADPVARSNSWKEMGSVPRDRVSIEDDAVREFRNHSIDLATGALTDETSAPRPQASFQKSRERATARDSAHDSSS
jgi:hypothetical protein